MNRKTSEFEKWKSKQGRLVFSPEDVWNAAIEFILDEVKKEDFNIYLKLCMDLRSEIDPVKERENLKGTKG